MRRLTNWAMKSLFPIVELTWLSCLLPEASHLAPDGNNLRELTLAPSTLSSLETAAGSQAALVRRFPTRASGGGATSRWLRGYRMRFRCVLIVRDASRNAWARAEAEGSSNPTDGTGLRSPLLTGPRRADRSARSEGQRCSGALNLFRRRQTPAADAPCFLQKA